MIFAGLAAIKLIPLVLVFAIGFATGIACVWLDRFKDGWPGSKTPPTPPDDCPPCFCLECRLRRRRHD